MYRLALRLGWSDPYSMLRGMSARVLQEWMEFARVEPFGEDREDARFASVVQVVSNAHRDRKKRHRPYQLEDCVLAGGDAFSGATPKPIQSWQAMKAIGAAMTMGSQKGN